MLLTVVDQVSLRGSHHHRYYKWIMLLVLMFLQHNNFSLGKHYKLLYE